MYYRFVKPKFTTLVLLFIETYSLFCHPCTVSCKAENTFLPLLYCLYILPNVILVTVKVISKMLMALFTTFQVISKMTFACPAVHKVNGEMTIAFPTTEKVNCIVQIDFWTAQ